MLTATAKKHTSIFKQPGGTSRGVLSTKNSWIITLTDSGNPGLEGMGEASIIENLSPDWNSNYESKLEEICKNVNEHAANNFEDLKDFPSIRFALECALIDIKHGGKGIYFPSKFTDGKQSIAINGLVWMGSKEFMEQQIREKLDEGFVCLKLKIGAIDFSTELELMRNIRKNFKAADVEIRVDANGAFRPDEAQEKLNLLSQLEIHSIEQPIMADLHEQMRRLCASPPIPIALDEDLIGINDKSKKNELISYINPQYIILKPSLLGGFKSCDEWIEVAERHSIGWWVTSALETNIGLNAIAQYTFTKGNPIHQGLGTGQLFTNNFESSLFIDKGHLWMKHGVAPEREFSDSLQGQG